MPPLWTTQLDNPEQGGRFLSEDGRREIRVAAETGDFDHLSDKVFLEINRASCERSGNVWTPMPITSLWTADSPSEAAIARVSAKRREALSPEARADIAARFANGHLFGYDITLSTDEVFTIQTAHNNLKDLGVQLCIGDKAPTLLVPSLSLLSALYVHLFGEDALLPLAVGGAVSRLDLHDLHVEGRRGVGLVLDVSRDEGQPARPALFAWHDIFHGLMGMLYGDRLIYRVARHFAYALEDCELRARELKPGFYASCASGWHDIRRDLHDLFVSRQRFQRAQVPHENLLFSSLESFLAGGEFHSKLSNADEIWQTFWQSLTARLSEDEDLKSDPQALALLKIAGILHPKPANVRDFDSLLEFWTERVTPEMKALSGVL